jgi:hypothetical protein
MANLETKFNDLVLRVQEKAVQEIVNLEALNNSYFNLIGKEDSKITVQLKKTAKKYDKKIKKLNDYKKRYDRLMNSTDNELKIYNSNKRNPIDSSYKINSSFFRKANKRTLTEQEYWENIFTTNLDINNYLEKLLPKLKSTNYFNIQDEVKSTKDKDLIGLINDSTNYIRSVIGERSYNIEMLSKEELFDLESGIKKYVSSSPLYRIDQMIDFIISIPKNNWDNLTDKEKRIVKEIKHKYEFDKESLDRITIDTENNLANAILKMNYGMRESNSKYKFVSSKFMSLEASPSIRLYLEKFTLENIRPKRDSFETKVVYENLGTIIKYHQKLSSVLESNEANDIMGESYIRKMKAIRVDYMKKGYLTDGQKNYGSSMIDVYFRRMKESNIWTLEKLNKLENALK